MKHLLFILLLAGCATKVDYEKPAEHLDLAYQFLGYTERTHTKELKTFIGFNPRYTEWCAGFMNRILEHSGMESLNTIKSRYPLAARSFLNYGTPVFEDDVKPGDLLIFIRGNSGWQGHVGLYVGQEVIKGRTYYRVLGGNQSNEVNISLYPKYKLLGIRRPYGAGTRT